MAGEADRMLSRWLQAIDMKRSWVYELNLVLCNTVDRAPLGAELQRCRTYFERQMEIVQPLMVVTLGRAASLAVLFLSLGDSRGRFHQTKWGPARSIYHPREVMDSPLLQSVVYQDLLAIRRQLEVEARRAARHVA